MTTYYSQAGEDQHMIEKYLHNVPENRKVYFEAGAMDGAAFSNTKALEDDFGWTGILVEPHPLNFEKLEGNRPKNKLFNTVISDSPDSLEYSYYVGEFLRGVSGIRDTMPRNLLKNFYNTEEKNEWIATQAVNLKTATLQPMSLTKIISDSGFEFVTFFSLDVEGHEFNVLNSYDWSRPLEYVLVERGPDIRVRQLLIEQGYTVLEDVAHNTLFHKPI